MPITSWTVLLTVTLSAASALGCTPVTETRQSIVPLAAAEVLRVKNPHGTVTVRRTEGHAVRVEATLLANDAQRLAASHVIVQSQGEGAELFVAWPDDTPLEGEGVELVIEVPRWSGVVVETEDGPLHVVDLDAPVAAVAVAW